MNRRKFIGLLGAAGAASLGLTVVDRQHSQSFTRAGGTAAQPNRAWGPASAGDGSALIVYFSHRRATYPELELEVGHTQRLAEFVRERVQADVFRVEPVEEYPEDYDALDRMAQQEEQNRTYRHIAPGAPNTTRYSTVFLGYPIWWGAQPMPLQTFMRDHNLNGKTIVPFCTHEGSSFGNSLDVLDDYYPDARVLEGLAHRGIDVYEDIDGARRAVDGWLQGHGF